MFVQPRKFFSIISNEKTQESIKRIIIYVLLFEIFVFSLLNLVYQNFDLNAIRIMGASLFDSLIVLIYLPIFVVVGRISKPKVSLKVSIAYLIIIKIVLGIGLIILTTLFLIYESYTFAIIRGVYYFFFLLLLYLAYSFIFNYELKLRIVSLLATIILVASFSIGFGFLLGLAPYEPKNFTSTMMITDPIGREVDNYQKSLHEFELFNNGSSIDSIISSYDKLKSEDEIQQAYSMLVVDQGYYIIMLKKKNNFWIV